MWTDFTFIYFFVLKPQVNLGEYVRKAICFLARNFYTLKYVALVLAFCINFVLLFYKVTVNHTNFNALCCTTYMWIVDEMRLIFR